MNRIFKDIELNILRWEKMYNFNYHLNDTNITLGNLPVF